MPLNRLNCGRICGLIRYSGWGRTAWSKDQATIVLPPSNISVCYLNVTLGQWPPRLANR